MPKQKDSQEGASVNAAKLLLVEDDPALSELLEYRFANEGYNVRTTPDGDEASERDNGHGKATTRWPCTAKSTPWG